MVREFVFGMSPGRITQEISNAREQTWDAILVSEVPPAPSTSPWYLVGIGAIVAVAILATGKKKHS